MRSPRDFFKPLAVGAPEPVREIPFRPSRVIHFFPPQNEKLVAKLPELVPTVDILLGNLEDAIPMADKEAARAGLVRVGKTVDFGNTQFWTRINSLDSPWALDDLTTLVTEIGDRLDVIMVPKVEGPEDIHYVDRLLAQLEARAGLQRPLLVHAILETARGVANIEEICAASPRMQGLSLGPADLAANRPPRLPGARRPADGRRRPRVLRCTHDLSAGPVALHHRPHGRCVRHVRAAAVLRPVRRHQGHGCVRRPVPQRVPAGLRRRLEPAPGAGGDGTGAIMLDGKMEDDASVKQCKVVVQLAHELAARDPQLAESYGF